MNHGRLKRLLLVGVMTASLAGGTFAQNVRDAYDGFNRFCIENFGAEKEPLTYTFAGKTLKFLDEGLWTHGSETSAAVGFETNLPAKAYVEYGETAAYGTRTQPQERHFYVHLRYLTGLKRNTLYHYRFVATDERGNRLTSQDMTLQTKTPANVVRIPEDMEGPPYNLDRKDATYLVTRDLTIEGLAFDVKVNNVTLDLGGHTVVYDNKHWGPVKPAKSFWDWIHKGKYGLRLMKGSGLRVLNGTLKQGTGNDACQRGSIGYNPMYLKGGSKMEIAGVTIDYSGPQVIGIYNHWGGSDSAFHHNVFIDRGTKITNRHGAGSRAMIISRQKNVKVHHNLVKRTRQGGLGGNEVYHNEVCMDSWGTNSFGVAAAGGGKAWGNRIVGGGYHICAFGWGSQITGHHNFVHLKAHPFKEKRWPEYGQYASVNAQRLTQYGGSKRVMENNLYHDNVFVVHSSGGRQTRGVQVSSDPFVKNYVFRDSIVKMIADDEKTSNASCIVTQGIYTRTDEMLPVYYRNCTFISNTCNVKFGDGYGVGSNHRFENCKFVKVGDHPKYRTFWFGRGYPCKNHVLLDCTYEDGADPGKVQWVNEKADHSFSVAWTLTVRTTPGAKITITDKTGAEVFSGAADAKGVVKAPLVQYVQKMTGRTEKTPHVVNVERGGAKAEKRVTMDQAKAIRL